MRTLLVAFLAILMIACASVTMVTRVLPESTTANRVIPVTAPEEFEGCGGTVIPVVNDDYEQAVVEQTNQIRMEHGLSPLKRVDGLNKSARYHAADMNFNDYFDHNTLDRVEGDLSTVCDTWNRIEAFYDDWLALAENIAAGQRVPEMAMEGWMNSPDHRHNILSDSYWEIGVGFFQGEGEYRYYWVQNFGRTNDRFPIVLNGEKALTQSSVTPVYIYGDWSEMRLRNNDGEWTEWMPFETSFQWRLPETSGEHTVTAELRGPDGETTTADTIELITPTASVP